MFLALLAIVAAALALLLAWRAHRAALRLALEMVQLRDRLAAAEAHYREHGERGARRAHDALPADPTLGPRLEQLEQRMRDAIERDAQHTPAVQDHDERAAIRRGLERQGYTRVAFLAAGPDGGHVVEAERGGVTSKGRVEVLADGRVRLHAVSTLRSFP